METFVMRDCGGLVVASIHKRSFAVDPAMPVTLAERPVMINGERFEAHGGVLGLNTEDYSRLAGTCLDGFLGADVGDRFVLRYRPERGSLTLDRYSADFALSIPVVNFGGLALAHITVGNRLLKAAFALGSRLSFIRPEIVHDGIATHHISDLIGNIGELPMPVIKLPVTIERAALSFDFGIAPAPLDAQMALLDVDAVIGNELLKHYAVDMDLTGGEVPLQELH